MDTKNNSTVNFDRYLNPLLILLCIAYGICCFYLYYHQCFYKTTGLFESDLYAHIEMAVKDKWFYSLTGLIYQLFFITDFGEILTALFLACVSFLTIIATALLLKKLFKTDKSLHFLLSLSLIANTLMAFYVKFACSTRYIGYQSPSIWHNSTYICMKLFAVLTVYFFIEIYDTYPEKLSPKTFILFILSLSLSVFTKTSFGMVFIPAMGIVILIDLFTKRAGFLKAVTVSLSVIPSFVILLWQNNTLFGENTGNSIIIKPWYALSLRGEHPKVSFVLSLVFLIVSAIALRKYILKDRNYHFSLLMWVMGFVWIFFFTESGERALDSNFYWGYSISLFFMYLISTKLFFENIKKLKPAAIVLCSLTLGYQVYCGILFFINLMCGVTYFM
ncbi:MAG: hypothetical protein K6F84_03450 [Lachnospiraceae bacterium]|nr:hypothetical protein [Lachnospiraceae bacterium]